MIYLAIVLFLSMAYFYTQLKKREKQLVKLTEINAQQQDNGKFYTKQLDHYLNEVNRISEYAASTHNQNNFLAEELRELKSQQQSKSVRLGLLTESVLPLHVDFGFDHKCLVPMFRPIDYLAFEDDKITFIEIKMGTSKLSDRQKNIKRLIEEGRVYFKEIRVNETGLETK